MTVIKAPKMTKAHSSLRAQKLVALGWTVKHEFKADNETYEWYLEWEHDEDLIQTGTVIHSDDAPVGFRRP
ncbi:hypothetical protein N027_00865 [Pseudomonas syringae USA007]|uniref:Uncharacterized protein n=1 Tax=Pseudomonas syringae USA007 TaxID=1357288 RepID=A0AAU8M9A0_PSESX|nr:hypothetical protein [Pseudomonas syringae]